MTTYIGIDPGLDGAVATRDSFGCRVFVTPTVKLSRGRTYDELAMREILVNTFNPFAVIERQQAFPKQGVNSVFTIGDGYGLWRGIVIGLGIPFQVVAPKTWQKAMHGVASGDPKGRSIMACQRMFPHVSLLKSDRCSKPHDGIADALLIAEYGRRIRRDSPGTKVRLETIEPTKGSGDAKTSEQ